MSPPTVGPRTRPMSTTERLWIVAEHMHPPFVNQVVLEGAPGDDLSEGRLAEAMAAVSAVHPGTRLRAAGALGWSRWEQDAPAPPVLTVDGSGWDGRSPAGARFLQLPLPAATGPTTGLLRVEGGVLRLVLRSHHATMDGGGTHAVARDLVRALRGEPPRGSTLDPTTDVDLARSLQPPAFQRRPHRFGAPTGKADGSLSRTTWARRTYTGRPRRLLPRVALAIQAVSRRWTSLPISLSVPVDLRRHRPELRSTANLTGAVFLDLDTDLAQPPAAGDQQGPADRLAALLAARAASGEAGKGLVAGQPLRWLPLGWLVGLGRPFMRKEVGADRYPSSGVISNLGRMDLAALSCPGFTAQRAFWIPPASEGQRLFLTLTGGPQGVELCCTMAEAFASGGRLDALLDGVIEELDRTAV